MSFAHNSQDWGGRRPENPPEAPKVTRKDLERFAQEHNFEIRRTGPGNGTWWTKCSDGVWRTAGMTNYLCLDHLKQRLEEEFEACKAMEAEAYSHLTQMADSKKLEWEEEMRRDVFGDKE